MGLKPNFASEYGTAVSLQVNAVAYELTHCGDTVRGKPETWPELERQVNEVLDRFRDRVSPAEVTHQLQQWLRFNEREGRVMDENEKRLREAKIVVMKQSDFARCPHVIMMPSHYRADGSCKCNDPNDTDMAEWGYVWNGSQWDSE